MSDTEEVVIKRPSKTKDTKPEIAREKLKEKRERLKKEKENLIIEEAKKRMVEEEKAKVAAEQLKKKEEDEKRKTDPNFILLDKFNELMAAIKPHRYPKSEDEMPVPKSLDAPKPRKPRAKKVVEDVIVVKGKKTKEPKEVKEPKTPKPRASRPRKVDSPSNNFVGFDKAPPAPNIVYEQPQPAEEGNPVNPLIAHLMGRRNLNTVF
jgi:hypothetical protein